MQNTLQNLPRLWNFSIWFHWCFKEVSVTLWVLEVRCWFCKVYRKQMKLQLTLCEFPQCRVSEKATVRKYFKSVTSVNIFRITSLLSLAKEWRKCSGPNNPGWSLPVFSISVRLINSPRSNWEPSLGYFSQNSIVSDVVNVTDFFCSTANIELTLTNCIHVHSLLEHLSFRFLVCTEKAEGLHHLNVKVLSENTYYFFHP